MSSDKFNIIHTTHPLTQELFRMMATPPEVIKANKNASQVQCTTCFATQHKLQTCQRCKSVWYCSKECQKKDWPRHKAGCIPSERPKGIKKLFENVMANITLVTMLQVCAALDMNLVDDDKGVGFKVPFMTRVDIAVEPCNVESLVKLYLTDEPAGEKMEGMVQFNCFRSHIPGQSGFIPLTTMRDNMWKSERAKLDKDPVHHKNPLGLLEFVINDSDFSITSPFAVSPDAMKMTRGKEPFVLLSGLTGTTLEKPMTVATCMEFMNTHIRSDKKNQLRLRVEMTDTDKAIVRSARNRDSDRPSVFLLKEKMARETIYASLLLH